MFAGVEERHPVKAATVPPLALRDPISLGLGLKQWDFCEGSKSVVLPLQNGDHFKGRAGYLPHFYNQTANVFKLPVEVPTRLWNDAKTIPSKDAKLPPNFPLASTSVEK